MVGVISKVTGGIGVTGIVNIGIYDKATKVRIKAELEVITNRLTGA